MVIRKRSFGGETDGCCAAVAGAVVYLAVCGDSCGLRSVEEVAGVVWREGSAVESGYLSVFVGDDRGMM